MTVEIREVTKSFNRGLARAILFWSGCAALGPLIFLVGNDSLNVTGFLRGYSAIVLLLLVFSLPLTLPLIAKYHRPRVDLYGIRKWHRINFVARHWYGETPLWLSFWLFFIGGSILLATITNLSDEAFDLNRSISPPLVLTYEVSFFLFFWSVWIWQMVGVLRSADGYKDARNALSGPELSAYEEELRKREDERNTFIARIGALPKHQQDFLMRKITERGSKKTYWGTLAQIVVVVVTLVRVAVSLNSEMAQLVDTLRVVFRGDPSLPAYSILVLENGTEVRINGGIKFGLADDLAKILSSGDIRVVRLNSPGGRLAEATRLFWLIRDRQLTTYVSGRCFSACTIVFAGGRERVIDSAAILGFHRGAFDGISEKDADRIERGIYATVGFDEKFVSKILSTPHSDIWKPSLQELIAARVITSVSDKP